MVNLELYKIFYTVARCGSLTKAAEELYISQPAVSQAIRQLEAQLGTPLFKRMHRGIELTGQGGNLILGDVQRALTILEGVEDKLAESRGSPSGTLRVGASEAIFQYILSDKIVEYHRLYPQVKIELLEDNTPRTIESLKTDRCDVAFLNLPISIDPELKLIESVMLLDDIFIAGKAYSELKGRELTVWDLERYPLLLLDQTGVARASIDHFAESGAVGQFFHVLGSVEQQRGCVRLEKGDEITIYTSCCNADKGIYYYTTYNNRRINKIDMHKTDLEASALTSYPLRAEEDIFEQN